MMLQTMIVKNGLTRMNDQYPRNPRQTIRIANSKSSSFDALSFGDRSFSFTAGTLFQIKIKDITRRPADLRTDPCAPQGNARLPDECPPSRLPMHSRFYWETSRRMSNLRCAISASPQAGGNASRISTATCSVPSTICACRDRSNRSGFSRAFRPPVLCSPHLAHYSRTGIGLQAELTAATSCRCPSNRPARIRISITSCRSCQR
jgi:hypothetical protein